MTTMHQLQVSEGSDHTRPIQFLTIGDQAQIPAPLIRITTCGLLTIEIAKEIVSTDPPQARYTSLTLEQLRGRGTGPALMLLKLFLNRHERFASREWLLEQFCHDGELFSSVRIDNIVSLLRSLLCSSSLLISKDLRTQLVAHVRSSSGDGYQLALYPRIWVDQDALAWNVEQAARMERFGDDSLPFWERAYEIARRGSYLPDEMYADWTHRQRGEVAGSLRQSVHALARLYQARHGAAGEEEALRLLRSHWLEHPREEDVLRPLMELLGKRECSHEALQYYEQLCRVLEEDERLPDAQTQDIAAYLRTKQITRVHERPRSVVRVMEHPALGNRLPDHSPWSEPSLCLATPSGKEAESLFLSQNNLSFENASRDWGIWFGLKSAQILAIIDHWQSQVVYCDQLQAILDQEILVFNSMQPPRDNETYLLSRRQALITIATLPATLSIAMQPSPSSPAMEEKLLVQCAASITALWHLLKGSELALVEQTLSTYLLNLVLLARKPSPYQKTAARLASQGYRLSGIVALHHNNLQAREQCCQQALLLSEIAEDTSLQVAARISLASTFYYRKDPTQASQTYQQALQHKDQIPPLQRSRVYAELAVAYAQQREEQEALRALGLARELYPEYPENDPSYLYAEFSPASFILEEGLTYLALAGHFPDQYYAQQAWEHFQHIETMRAERIVPDRIFYEITNRQAETALMLQDAELFQTYWERGITGATLLHSRQRYQEAAEIYEKATTAWPDEPSVKALQERLHLSA